MLERRAPTRSTRAGLGSYAQRAAAGGALVVAGMIARGAHADTPTRVLSPAPTEVTARARALFIEGTTRAEAGDWEGARDRFARSLELKRATLTLYNLGIAQEETGHVLDAMASFREFLAQPADPATQRYLEPVRNDLVRLEARVARVEVRVEPASVARVVLLVDGREVTPARGSHAMDPGPHELALSAPGLGETRQRTTLPEGAHSTLVLDLTSRGGPATGSAALPIALTVAGVAAFAGGVAVFGIGAGQALDTHPQASSTRTMIGGATVELLGAISAGAGVALLLTRPPRARTAGVAPWLAGTSAGVRGWF